MRDRRIGARAPADTPETIRWRIAHYEVLAQVNRERELRGPVTVENAKDMLDWQAARIEELMKASGLR